MRGQVTPQQPLWYAIVIPVDHPLREVKRRADAVLAAMDKEFRKAYSKLGRPSVPPEMLLKALLLQALYSIRSERRWRARIWRSSPVWITSPWTER